MPDIQDTLRAIGFPRFTEGEAQSVRIRPNAPPEITPLPRFEFQDKARQTGIVIGKDVISVHASVYTDFETFCSQLRLALQTVNYIVKLGLIERVGLRYVNLVRTSPGETVSQYVHCGLLGLDPGTFEARDAKLFVQMLSTTAHGTLAIRFFQRDDGGFLPPDVEPSPLCHPELNPPVGKSELVSLLDFDHYRAYEAGGATEFSLDEIMDLFWRLHDTTDLAFRAAVTDHAMQAWGQG